MPENKIVDNNLISNYLENYNVEDILELSNGKSLIRYEEEDRKDFNSKFNLSYSSIAISAAITALLELICMILLIRLMHFILILIVFLRFRNYLVNT